MPYGMLLLCDEIFVASYVTMHVSNQTINHNYIGVIIMIFVYNNYVVSVAEQPAMPDKAAQLSQSISNKFHYNNRIF